MMSWILIASGLVYPREGILPTDHGGGVSDVRALKPVPYFRPKSERGPYFRPEPKIDAPF